MAISSSMQWWIRVGGSSSNAGGFDASIAGAGTNYANQDAAQYTFTDLASAGGSATVTSAAAGFTSDMVGNAITISSGGATYTHGYYVITTYNSSTSVTLDRVCSSGAETVGVGVVGGAFASLQNLSNGGAYLHAAPLATPLAAGHTINIRGSGSNDPSIGSPDYSHGAGYWTFPSGDLTSGSIKFVGYNGRPCIGTSFLFLYEVQRWSISNIKFFSENTSYATYGIIYGNSSVESCKFDQNGYDGSLLRVTFSINNEFVNTGSTASGSEICLRGYTSIVAVGNYFSNIRGSGIGADSTAYSFTLINNIISGCRGTGGAGIIISSVSDANYAFIISNNTIDGGSGDGIKLNNSDAVSLFSVLNNIISNHTGGGKYGFNISVNTTALNDKISGKTKNYNNYYNNTSNYNNISAGANDTTLDPTYANSGSGDFSVGTNMGNIGFPGAFPASLTTGYLDIGAVQRRPVAPTSGFAT